MAIENRWSGICRVGFVEIWVGGRFAKLALPLPLWHKGHVKMTLVVKVRFQRAFTKKGCCLPEFGIEFRQQASAKRPDSRFEMG